MTEPRTEPDAPRGNTVSAEEPPRSKRLIIYNFKRPDKFSKEQIRILAIIHETFARLATNTVSAQLRSLVNAHVLLVDQCTYGEFIASLPSPTMLATVTMEPLRVPAIVEFDPTLTFAVLNRLFGGGDRELVADRDLTTIEAEAMKGFLRPLLADLRSAWSQVMELNPAVGEIETNPRFAQIVPPKEMIVLVALEVKVGATQGTINLCFPYLTIEPVVPKLSLRYLYSQGQRTASPEDSRTLFRYITDFHLPAEVVFEGETLSLKRLGSLRRGSLIRLPGHERGRARLRMGHRILFQLRSVSRTSRSSYDIVGNSSHSTRLQPDETAPDAGPFAEESRKLFEELSSVLHTQLSQISSEIALLNEKQDDLADQLAFASTEQDYSTEQPHQSMSRPFAFIRRADFTHFLNLIQREHPQTIALVLCHLEPQTASLVLARLHGELQGEVAERVSSMGRTDTEVVRTVERVLRECLSAVGSQAYTEAGGVESLVEILHMVDRSTEKQVVERLQETHPEIVEEIKKRLFVFDDIVLLEPQAVEKVLRRVDVSVLIRALKAAAEEVSRFIRGCMPEGAVEELQAGLKDLGPVRLSEVDSAQQEIVSIIREMEENGEIVVARRDETV